MDNVEPYIDDIIIGSTGETWDEVLENHERDVRKALDRLAENTLLASKKKAQLFALQVEFCVTFYQKVKRLQHLEN